MDPSLTVVVTVVVVKVTATQETAHPSFTPPCCPMMVVGEQGEAEMVVGEGMCMMMGPPGGVKVATVAPAVTAA